MISKNLIFRLPSLNVWAIGPKVGINYLYLVHVDGSHVECPENLTDDVSPWFYLTKGTKVWKNDVSIKLTCVQDIYDIYDSDQIN